MTHNRFEGGGGYRRGGFGYRRGGVGGIVVEVPGVYDPYGYGYY
jgi:hypothetical protein